MYYKILIIVGDYLCYFELPILDLSFLTHVENGFNPIRVFLFLIIVYLRNVHLINDAMAIINSFHLRMVTIKVINLRSIVSHYYIYLIKPWCKQHVRRMRSITICHSLLTDRQLIIKQKSLIDIFNYPVIYSICTAY